MRRWQTYRIAFQTILVKEVLRFMRRDPQLKSTPVIVVSARSMPSDIREGLEAGATIYLAKPVGYLDLKKSVDQVMEEEPSDNSNMELPT